MQHAGGIEGTGTAEENDRGDFKGLDQQRRYLVCKQLGIGCSCFSATSSTPTTSPTTRPGGGEHQDKAVRQDAAPTTTSSTGS
jgi:hypothetical protein